MVCFQMQHAKIDFLRSKAYSLFIHIFFTFIILISHIQLYFIIKVHILEITRGNLFLQHFQHPRNHHLAHTGEPW